MSRGPFQPGDQCNQYRIVRALGRGGFGCVYEAVREFHIPAKGVVQQFGQRVALKCLQLDQASDAQRIERLNLEAVLLMDLKHDNIVGFLDWGVTEAGVVYFAMDLLQGKTLAEHLRSSRFSITRSLYVASEIAEGLVFAHEKHITHRDLKPPNVFVTSRWEIKLLDLGAAKYEYFWGVSTTTGRAPCTVSYAAPEQLNGSGRVDNRADVFALGVITYQMLTGQHPFRGDARTMGEYVARQLECRPPALAQFGIPENVATIVHRSLLKEPENRFASAAEMLNALRHAFAQHTEGRLASEDQELAQLVQRRNVRARILQDDESDPVGRPGVGLEHAFMSPSARSKFDRPSSLPTVIISDGPKIDVSFESRGSLSSSAPSQSRASDHPSRGSGAGAATRKKNDVWAVLGGLYERTPRIAAVWAAGLLMMPLGWILLGGPHRAPAASAKEAVAPPPAMTLAAPVVPPPETIAAVPQETATAAPLAVADLPANVETRADKVAPPHRKAKTSQKRSAPLYGIHVPEWDKLASPNEPLDAPFPSIGNGAASEDSDEKR